MVLISGFLDNSKAEVDIGNLIKFCRHDGIWKMGIIIDFINRKCQTPIVLLLQNDGKIYQYVNTLFVNIERVQ